MGRSDTCCGRIGTSFRAQKWLSLDPCGFICVHFSLGVHIYALVVIALKLISHSTFSTTWFFAVYIPTALLALISLFMAWSSNPGAVPMGARPLTTFRRSSSNEELRPKKRGTRRCSKCNDNYKPPRAHHDSVTGRCIVKLDHFCPWVGNAVGALNHKFFILFIFYTLLTSIQALMLIVIRMVRCGYVHDDSSDDGAASPSTGQEAQDWDNVEEAPEQKEGFLDPTRMMDIHSKYVYPECEGVYQYNLVLLLFIASIVFMIFTCSMLVENIEAIESNTGKIARMKMRVGKGGTELSRVTHSFNEMFGGDSNRVAWHWFLPLPVKFPTGMDKVVLGYEWDPTFEPVPFESPQDDDDDEEEDGAVMAQVIGEKGEPPDVEQGDGLYADPNKPPSLGETSDDDSSFASISAAKGVRVRKKDSFRASQEKEENLTPVERTGNGLT